MAQTVAKVKYTGQMTSDIRRGPSGYNYHFKNPMGGDPRAVSVGSIEDALWLDRNSVFETEWTAYGKLAKKLGGPVSDVKNALKGLSYRQKQKLVSGLSLDVAGNASEQKIDDALEPMIEDLQREMENR